MNSCPDNSLGSRPCVSIITATYNAAGCIQKSIESVVNQSCGNIEYIIIDGGSTDATVSIINAYRGKVTHFVSEPDGGIYDAMNKGIRLASGQWLYFLGADDILATEEIIEDLFQLDLTRYTLVIGDIVSDDNGKHYISKFDWRLLFKNTVHHQGTLYRRSLFESFQYDTNAKISGDYELNLKAYLAGCQVKEVAQVIAICGNRGVSKITLYHGYLEEIRIRNKYMAWPLAAPFNLLTLGRFSLKRVNKYAVLGARRFRRMC